MWKETLTDSELMYQKRSATGSDEFAVQFKSTNSPGEYRVFWPVMYGLWAGTAESKNQKAL